MHIKKMTIETHDGMVFEADGSSIAELIVENRTPVGVEFGGRHRHTGERIVSVTIKAVCRYFDPDLAAGRRRQRAGVLPPPWEEE